MDLIFGLLCGLYTPIMIWIYVAYTKDGTDVYRSFQFGFIFWIGLILLFCFGYFVLRNLE